MKCFLYARKKLCRTCALALAALFAVLAVGCGSSPAAAPRNGAKTPPLWVMDKNAAYPESEWLCAVEDKPDRKAAESAAVISLAGIFRVDLNAVTTANEEFTRTVSSASGKDVSVSSSSRSLAQELVSTSNVSGLIGLQVESWTAPYGKVYANARMNRRECSARYLSMMRENEKVIRQLKDDAAKDPATFEAYQMLQFAVSVARVNDNFRNLLMVLDTSETNYQSDYGNAEAVRALAQNTARSIVITVKVDGDQGGRIAKAFADVFSSRGFRTSGSGANAYLLSSDFTLEDVDLPNNKNVFVRYVLNCSLKNRAGVELLSFSENDREGHATKREAEQRAIRSAEGSIGNADKANGFAAKFDEYLKTLL
jgi:hypothetical protein